MSHVEKWRAGESIDPDSQHQPASVAFWAMVIMQYERDGQEGRPNEMGEETLAATFAPVETAT